MTEIPAVPTELYWSPSLYASQGWGLCYSTLDGDFVRPSTLPADAVRLVPESEVQFVLDDNERMLAQHAADVAEIDRLRSELDHAGHFGRGEFRVTSWAYEQVCRTDREKGEKIADLMREVAELRAGAVPDTGQAREQILQRDSAFGAYVIAVCDAIGLPHFSPLAAVVEAIRAAVAAAEAPESPTEPTAKGGRCDSSDTETTTGTVQAPSNQDGAV